jgi:hypothetical protein
VLKGGSETFPAFRVSSFERNGLEVYSLEALLFFSVHQSDLDGLECRCLFDVAYVTKWVQPRETLSLALLGLWVCFVSEVERGF